MVTVSVLQRRESLIVFARDMELDVLGLLETDLHVSGSPKILAE